MVMVIGPISGREEIKCMYSMVINRGIKDDFPFIKGDRNPSDKLFYKRELFLP